MQFIKQVVILGIGIFEKQEETVQWNHIDDRVRIINLICCFHLNFKLYSSLLQCSGYIQLKNGVDLVEVCIVYKLEKTSGQTLPLIKIKTVVLFLFYHRHLVFQLHLLCFGHIQSKNEVTLLEVSCFSKLGQEWSVINFGPPIEKRSLLYLI